MANLTGDKNDKNTPPQPRMSRGILSWMLICFVLIMAWSMINSAGGGNEISSWNDFLTRAKAGQFEDNRVTVQDTEISAKEEKKR